MKKNGFTLLELLAVIAMTGILAASAFDGYGKHLHKRSESQAITEIYRLAQQLEIHRGNNFSYAGFTTATSVIPLGATGNKIKYNVSINDAGPNTPAITSATGMGRDYIIRAISTSGQAHSFLYTSKGLRCKNKASNRVTVTGCGTVVQGSSSW